MSSWEDFKADFLGQNPEIAREVELGKAALHLAENLLAWRQATGVSQTEIARLLGTSQPRIADIERGTSNPTLRTVSRIAEVLGTTADRMIASPEEAARRALVTSILDSVRAHYPGREDEVVIQVAGPSFPVPAMRVEVTRALEASARMVRHQQTTRFQRVAG